jgi:choline dehydrogenase-like flavoprotein
MIVDARRLAPGTELAAEVCVVGAGPVGLAVAEALAAGGVDVVLLDSGGPEHDPAADELGEPAAIEFGTVRRLGHTRRIGGNAHAWQVRTGVTERGVRMMPLSGAELEEWPGRASAWPVAPDELARYLDRACAWLGLPPGPFDLAPWTTEAEREHLLDDGVVRSAAFLFANGGALAERAAPSLQASAVRCYHHATAAEVLTDPAGTRATGVRAVSAPGRELVVTARTVVVAAGAMATTQLLLSSDAVHTGGLGNAYDQLGRCFMDHPLLAGGFIRPARPGDVALRVPYDMRLVRGVPVMGHLALTDDTLRSGLPALSMLLFPRTEEHVTARPLTPRQQQAVSAALEIREAVIRRQRPRPRTLARAIIGLDGVAVRLVRSQRHPRASLGRGGWSAGDPSRFTRIEVIHQAEQAPHPDNRITLSDARDRLGLRRIEVHWRWREEDAEAVVRAQEVYREALARAGWGTYEPARADGGPVVESSSSHHFMGTTRMSATPREGVVDPDGAVHGVPNLFVASTSTFPRGGYANVTLTAIALGLRIADRILARRRPAVVGPAAEPAPRSATSGLAKAAAAAALAAGAFAVPGEVIPNEPPAPEPAREAAKEGREDA